MFGISLFIISQIATTLGMVVFWILTYFPIRINWHFCISYFLASISVGFIGVFIAIFQGIFAFLQWLF